MLLIFILGKLGIAPRVRIGAASGVASTFSSHWFRSLISSRQTECSIGYSCHSTAWPSARSASREASARASGMIPSKRPWARKIGTSALAALRSAAVLAASGR